jgi:hypothetical protein
MNNQVIELIVTEEDLGIRVDNISLRIWRN